MGEGDAGGAVAGGTVPASTGPGGAVPGGARAGDPLAGDHAIAIGADGHTREQACLNCGTALAGEFCHACGQHGHVHRTLSAFFHDFLHSFLHFEGRLWRTLPLLAWRPGELTRRYIEGQRARFISPMALFLFSVFLLFAVLGSLGNLDPVVRGDMKGDLAATVRKSEQDLAALERDRARALAAGRPTAALDTRIEDLTVEVRAMRGVLDSGVIGGARNVVSLGDRVPAWIRAPIDQASRNPELLLYKLRMNAYKWSWALIPLSVPFLWLLFPFSKRFRLYDHMVFVTYSLSFMTLLVIVTSLVAAAGWSGAVAVAMFVPAIHMFRQIKGAYALTGLGALWRTVLLTVFALTAALLFVTMIVGLGLFD